MKKKKLAAGILIGTMLIGLLSGCRGKGQSELLNPNQEETKTGKIAQSSEDGKEYDKSGESQAGGINTPVSIEPVTDDEALWSFSYKMIKENIEEVNPVLSPMSVYLAMGMVGLGAKGDTLTEFENVMGKEMHTTAGKLMQELPSWLLDETNSEAQSRMLDETDSKLQSKLNVANAVWVDETMHPKEDWLKDVSEIYHAEAYRSKLSSAATQNDINHWIEEKTHSLIKNFLDRPLEEETKMALFNTIYFLGKWRNEFDPISTRKEDFTTTDGQTVKVDMMNDQRTEFYVQNKTMDGVVMDYLHGDMAFLALKPTAGQTVRELYQELDQEAFAELLDNGQNTLMKLKLPKFEVEFDRKLNETLQNMGIQQAFDDELADFSGLGITDNGYPLYISLVRQKAVVKLDEEGTEAAAVTMVAMKECASAERVEKPLEVYFDEPFLYMILHKESKTPLFIGIMDEPGVK